MYTCDSEGRVAADERWGQWAPKQQAISARAASPQRRATSQALAQALVNCVLGQPWHDECSRYFKLDNSFAESGMLLPLSTQHTGSATTGTHRSVNMAGDDDPDGDENVGLAQMFVAADLQVQRKRCVQCALRGKGTPSRISNVMLCVQVRKHLRAAERARPDSRGGGNHPPPGAHRAVLLLRCV